jgi:hypothetical protein
MKARVPADDERTYKTQRVVSFGRPANRLLIQASVTSKGEVFLASDVDREIAKWVNAGTFFKRRSRLMSDKAAEATAILDNSIEGFSKSLRRFDEIQDGFIGKCKRASGDVRDAAEKLAQGIARVEKAANFDRLERYVTLLERAATAMKMLAELEAQGKLDKIANAMR